MMRTILLAVLALAPAAVCSAAAPREVTDEDLERATGQAIRYLWSKMAPSGHWAYQGYNIPGGGETALACFALLEAGENPNDERMKTALKALSEIKTENLYVVAVRVMALSQVVVAGVKDPDLRQTLEADIKWLSDKALGAGGAWGYGGPERTGDNSCSQFALLALWEADRAGIPVNQALLKRVESTWLARQRKDGGWTYQAQTSVETESTATMTTAGLASLYLCEDVLHTACAPYPTQRQIDRAWDWLGEKLKEDYYKNDYLAFCMQRVGMASGAKFVGKMDWFAVGAGKMAEPNPYGTSYAGQWGPIVRASFELIFLTRCRTPLTINKLRHGEESNWNVHTRDVPNFTEYMRRNFERRMRWQLVSIDDDPAMLLDAPILLVTGGEALKLTPPQWARLREYALRGGTILMLATHGSKPFVESAKEGLKDLFTEQRQQAGGHYALEALPADHPVYTLHEPIPNGPTAAPMWGISDGTRLLAILCQRDIACTWQKKAFATGKIDYGLGVNLYLYTTGGNTLRMRLRPVFADTGKGEAKHHARMAVLRHGGNWCVQPYALEGLAGKLMAEDRVVADVTFGVPIQRQALAGYNLAWMVGASSFTLKPGEMETLKEFLDNGGTLFVNAVGGSRDFGDSARKMLDEMFPDIRPGGELVPFDHPILTGKAGDFRGPPVKSFARTLDWQHASASGGLTVRVYNQQDRSFAIFCPNGIHDTLDGHTVKGALSYMPSVARDIATNIVLYSMLQEPRMPTTATASAPASGPTSGPATRAASMPPTAPAAP